MVPNFAFVFCLMFLVDGSVPQSHPGESGVAPDAQPQVHNREKRFLWITNDGRIALPPGTVLTITPTILLPFVRYPPYGFLSNMSMSFPFTIDFDKLGLTDNENPYGALPPVFGRAFHSREAGVALGEFIASFMNHRLHKRDAPEMPENAFQGGERALLYGIAEDMLSQFGMDGKACLLRAICEVHGHPLDNFGFVGEIIRLFFTIKNLEKKNFVVPVFGEKALTNWPVRSRPIPTYLWQVFGSPPNYNDLLKRVRMLQQRSAKYLYSASKSPFAELMKEYVEAEKTGKSHGECWPYFKACPKSLFLPSSNKYTKDSIHTDSEVDFDEDLNKIPRSLEPEQPKRTPTRNKINPAM